MIIEVPFANPIHAVPDDFYRFTVEGMKTLLSEEGFSIKSAHITQPASYYYIWDLWQRIKKIDFLPLLILALLVLRIFVFISGINRTLLKLSEKDASYSQFIVLAEKP